jgi:hypothetical protein
LRWEFEAFIAGVVAVVAMFWLGLQQPVGTAMFSTTAWLPTAMSCVWLVAGMLVAWKCWPLVRRHGRSATWRSVQVAVAVATMGLALASIGIQAGAVGELRHQFGGMDLVQQHVSVVPPALRHQIGSALKKFPTGTHVSVSPRRSLWRHRFYYETYPDLVVDTTSTNLIRLGAQ